jgi:periplasmic divalent cation tolerance protein
MARQKKNNTDPSMKSPKSCRIVLVTAPDLKSARKMIRVALRNRLVACANIIPGLESHYWWKEKLERSREVLILFKTTTSRVLKLQALVAAEHPYTTPEFVSLGVDHVSEHYLTWWKLNIR